MISLRGARGRTRRGGTLSLVDGEPRSVNSTTEFMLLRGNRPFCPTSHQGFLARSHFQGMQLLGVQGEEVLQLGWPFQAAKTPAASQG